MGRPREACRVPADQWAVAVFRSSGRVTVHKTCHVHAYTHIHTRACLTTQAEGSAAPIPHDAVPAARTGAGARSGGGGAPAPAPARGGDGRLHLFFNATIWTGVEPQQGQVGGWVGGRGRGRAGAVLDVAPAAGFSRGWWLGVRAAAGRGVWVVGALSGPVGIV